MIDRIEITCFVVFMIIVLSLSFSHPVLSNSLRSMDCSTPGLPVPHHLPELPKFMSIASVLPYSHLILWCPLLLLPSMFPSIRVFSSELAVCIRWPASASVLPRSIRGWFPLPLTGLISLLSMGLSGVFSNTTIWKHQFFGAQPSLLSSSPICTSIPGRP